MPHGVVGMPEKPPKMKPMLHLDMEDIKGLNDVDISDRLTLMVKVKVVGINKHEEASGGSAYTGLTLEVQEASSERNIEPEK